MTVPEEGMSITFDRPRALARDDIGFMSWDHPMLRTALDLLLGGEQGNSTYGEWKGGGSEGMFMEIQAVAECVAPSELHVDRFLPATPIRVVVDHSMADVTGSLDLAEVKLDKGDVFRLLDRGAIRKKVLPAMLAKAQEFASTRMQAIVTEATSSMDTQYAREVQRLETLRELNDHVTSTEIAEMRRQQTQLKQALASTTLRVDSIKLVMRLP
jgi:ATP-dependent helicase HepA